MEHLSQAVGEPGEGELGGHMGDKSLVIVVRL